MYRVIRPAYKVGTADGGYAVPEAQVTFTTAAGLLRWAIREDVFGRWARNGKPKRFSDPRLGHDGRNGNYGVIDTFSHWKITAEHIAAMRRAQQRYNDVVHYLREVEPEWRPDVELTGNAKGHLSFADNSTELHEINKYGKRRHSFVVAPHGDIC